MTTGGEGGAVSTNDERLATKIKKLSLMESQRWMNRFKKGGNWEYDIVEMG